MADPAAQTFSAEGALVLLKIHAKEAQIDAIMLGFSNRLNRSLVTSPVPGVFYIFIYQVI
jgi:hypothetical protein